MKELQVRSDLPVPSSCFELLEMPLPSTSVEQNKVDTNLDLAGQILANSQVTLNSSVNVTIDTFVVLLNLATKPPAAVPLLFTRVQDVEDKNMRSRLLQIRVDECTPFTLPKLPLKTERMFNDKKELEHIKEDAMGF